MTKFSALGLALLTAPPLLADAALHHHAVPLPVGLGGGGRAVASPLTGWT
ncbi:hypothetical protein CU044_0138 [Streptomyces sp. L-9-10]|nr:hypothetical protein [Streptomyces sp. L-9-10]RYJ31771.1 hypothetical protein CU044_0138 [Streptomyces sp. L-9-10]